MHEMGRAHHFEERADPMVASFADSSLNVSRGNVTVGEGAKTVPVFGVAPTAPSRWMAGSALYSPRGHSL
jgi:hypothetical protein